MHMFTSFRHAIVNTCSNTCWTPYAYTASICPRARKEKTGSKGREGFFFFFTILLMAVFVPDLKNTQHIVCFKYLLAEWILSIQNCIVTKKLKAYFVVQVY
jgi:hypothetical protein